MNHKSGSDEEGMGAAHKVNSPATIFKMTMGQHWLGKTKLSD